MAQTSEEKSVDHVEKLYEIFSKLMEQPKVVTSKILKYTLEPNPVKLSGPENYVSWARHCKLILSSHGYERLLVDSDKEKREVDIASKQISDRVLVWMLNSMEPIIREQVKTLTTPTEVWSELERQFAEKSNKMQATRSMHELTHLKQGSRSVVEYAGEVKKNCTETYTTIIHLRRLTKRI
jgi:hypothetical protein